MKLHCRACGAIHPLASGMLRCECGRPLEKRDRQAPSLSQARARIAAGQNGWQAFRESLGSWQLACEAGRASEWDALVTRLDANTRSLRPQGLLPTPLADTSTLVDDAGFDRGGLFAKNEFEFLMGSHKARHMISSALYLAMASGKRAAPLSIFSCGNAALGAAAVAQALGQPLYTFVPSTLNPNVEHWLTALAASVVKVRREGSVGEGDPCHNRYQESLSRFGWTPFSCYGHDIWPSVEGAEVLGLELFVQIADRQKLDAADLDALIVQVGGGGLAHGLADAIETALDMGLLARRPRLYCIQTASCFPLAESWLAMTRALAPEGFDAASPRDFVEKGQEAGLATLAARAESPEGEAFLVGVARERERWFTPWARNVPESIADGILDDTTYDGLEIVRALFVSRGLPWVVDEQELAQAARAVHAHGQANVSPTGTAAFAGLLSLRRAGVLTRSSRVALLLTGVETRGTPPSHGKGRVFEVGPADDLAVVLGCSSPA